VHQVSDWFVAQLRILAGCAKRRGRIPAVVGTGALIQSSHQETSSRSIELPKTNDTLLQVIRPVLRKTNQAGSERMALKGVSQKSIITKIQR
jgi:hypothetical protein